MSQKLLRASQLALKALQSAVFFCKSSQVFDQCNSAIVALNIGIAEKSVETVELIGLKNGVETLLGKTPMPPRMKARELATDMFGGFTPDDGSDADLCFASMCNLLDWMQEQATLIENAKIK